MDRLRADPPAVASRVEPRDLQLMTIHIPVAAPRLVAAGGPVSGAIRALLHDFDARPLVGPVTDAIRTMRAAFSDFDADLDLRALRRALAERIEADIATLDLMGGDPDLEDGGDAEPSLCGPGSHLAFGNHPGFAANLHGCRGDGVDLEGDDADEEPNGDDEPSLGSINPNVDGGLFESTAGLVRLDGTSQLAWASGSADDNGIADVDGAAEQFGRLHFGPGGVS